MRNKRGILGAMLVHAGIGGTWLALSSAVDAQSYRDVAPQALPAPGRSPAPTTPPEPLGSSTQIAVESLRGLAFVAVGDGLEKMSAADAQPDITATGLPLLDESFLRRFANDLGRPLSFGRLADIRRAVVQRYRAAGKPLVDVYVPEQNVTNGVVTIAVAEFRVDKIVARGNRYFSDAVLIREMPLASGAPVREADVSSGLALLNANPYRSVDVIYAPGAAANSTDVILQTHDRLPLRVYGGFNNDGVSELGRNRFLAGIDYGNLFGLDQQISYQATASNDVFSGNPPIEGRPDRPRFVAQALHYDAPLPWQDRIEIFGMYAQSTPRLPDTLGQTGVSAQLSFRYDWRLAPIAGWQQQAQFGYDFKRSNNDLEFGGVQVFDASTHIHQLVVAYDATRSDGLGQSHANAMFLFSPGGLGSDNGGAAFDTARSGATPRYQYLQLSAQREIALGVGFTLSVHGLFQWTPDTLLPSEELGLGGDGSLRGYEPYVTQGDRGWNLQTELRAPAFAFGMTSASLAPFLFVDAGHVWNRIDQPAETSVGCLASFGAGLGFQFSRYVSVRGTYGVPLRAAGPNGSKAPLAEVFVDISD